MEIKLQGQYSQQDIRRALSLGYKRWFNVWRVVFGIGAVGGALYYAIENVRQSIGEPLLMVVSLLLFFSSLLIPGYLLALPLFQARRLAKTPLFQGAVSGVATGEVLEFRSELSESRMRWDAYIRHKMSADMVLLYQSKEAFIVLPRSFFASDDDWQRFRQHVQKSVPERA